MKYLLKLLIVLSLLIISVVGYKLLDTYISLKYEVEEPIAMSKNISEILKTKEHYINQLIFWLWIIIGIQIINIALFFKILTNNK